MISSTRIESIRPGMTAARFSGGVALAALLAACSGDMVNIGDGEPAREPPPSYSRCIESPTLEGTVVVNDQAQLDALDGCETIVGDLFVQPLFYPDLRPLHALREVTGWLALTQAPLDGLQSAVELNLMQSIYDGGWLPTLAGLEKLERAGSLYIAHASAPDLEPLSGMRELTGEGLLGLQASAVRDLAPLGQLRGIRDLFVDGDQLESIADLELPPVMKRLSLGGPRLTELGQVNQVRTVSESLSIGTALRDLSALSALEEVNGSVAIGGPLLESLDGLEQLNFAGDFLQIMGNPLLRNIDALAGLQAVGRLEIYDNGQLKRIPDFPELLTEMILIGNNAELEEIASFTGEQRRLGRVVDGTYRAFDHWSEADYVDLRHDAVYVFDNPKLQAYAIPKGLQSSKTVVIANNASLTDLDIGTLEAVDLLSIKGNPALERVNIGDLATVDLLSVQGNPLLPLEVFDAVQSFERRMSSAPVPPLDCSAGECAP
jgi:Leucine-rich repeat (LRR) protein